MTAGSEEMGKERRSVTGFGVTNSLDVRMSKAGCKPALLRAGHIKWKIDIETSSQA